MQNIKMFFKSKKPEPVKQDSTMSQDLAIITQMNQEFATSLDLNETLQTSLEVIIKRINAQAANIFLIEEKKQVFQCIASKHQAYLDFYLSHLFCLTTARADAMIIYTR